MELMETTLKLLEADPRLVILVTHDPREAVFLGKRVLVLGQGGLVLDERFSCRSSGSPEARAAEERLLAAISIHGALDSQRPSIYGALDSQRINMNEGQGP
jgi:NitT/TauT family transport system ATP-binding protein